MDAERLRNIIVHPNNSYYTSLNGVLFKNNMVKLVYYPPRKTDPIYCIPSQVKVIGKNAFSNYYLRSVQIPNGVQKILKYAFVNALMLSISVPPSCVYIAPDTINCRCKTISIQSNTSNLSQLDFQNLIKNDVEITLLSQS